MGKNVAEGGENQVHLELRSEPQSGEVQDNWDRAMAMAIKAIVATTPIWRRRALVVQERP